jgi:hypothetical protein
MGTLLAGVRTAEGHPRICSLLRMLRRTRSKVMHNSTSNLPICHQVAERSVHVGVTMLPWPSTSPALLMPSSGTHYRARVPSMSLARNGAGRQPRPLPRPRVPSTFRIRTGEDHCCVSQAKLGDDERIAGVSDIHLADIARLIVRGGWPSSVTDDEYAAQRSRDYVKSVIESDTSRVDGIEKNPRRVRPPCAGSTECPPILRHDREARPTMGGAYPPTGCWRWSQRSVTT